jgi:hypothetical protein
VSQIQTDLTLLRSTQTKNQTEKTLHGGNKTKESRMPRDFFDQTPEQQNVVLIESATLGEAEPYSNFMPHRQLNIDAIRAELSWVNETPDPKKCGCRNLIFCEETGHKPFWPFFPIEP